MGIYTNGKETTSIHGDGKSALEVWNYVKGAWRMVWQAIRSCFGRGFWANWKPWSNTDGWRNF